MNTTVARPPSIDPLDLLGLDDDLSAADRLIRDTVRAFVARRVTPYVAEWFEAATFPSELARELGELGLLGMHLAGYDCAGASATAYGVACRELEAADSGLRSFVSVQGSLAMFPIHAFGSEEQKQTWLPRMARGEAIGCFGLTEWDFGSEPAGMRTTARRDGSDYVINGGKAWITNGAIADVAIVWAHTGAHDGASGAGSDVRGFVVPTSTKGFSARNISRKLSLRASVTSELLFDECRVPAAALLPNVSGMRGPLSCLNEARYGIVWGVLGAARTCYETALAYAKSRFQFGKPIASFQLTQAKLVDMALELQKGQLLATKLGQLKDAQALLPQHVSIGKLNNVREALAICRQARTILGASGITLDYPVIRHINNLESVLTYEGTSEIHTLILGQAITGIAAFA
ncbi:MAG: acyl-CoA dehydrogenase family protein [Candidatus Eremiobacteraeota bacterium]|nr:acyl-CoA dehydrogenase family protein [Candidatus Eremiobacteraeota bacterium]